MLQRMTEWNFQFRKVYVWLFLPTVSPRAAHRLPAPLDKKRKCFPRKNGLKAKGWLRDEHWVIKRKMRSRKERIKRNRSVRRCYRKMTLGTHISSIPALQDCQMVQNLANIAKTAVFHNICQHFWQYFYAKNCHYLKCHLPVLTQQTEQSILGIYQMTTETFERKYSTIINRCEQSRGKGSRTPRPGGPGKKADPNLTEDICYGI